VSRRKRRGPKTAANSYQRADHYTRRAKAAGFAARSVFKLEEIDRRTRIIKQNHRVLDLGAAPGSWSAYAAQRIGKRGVLVAIDLKAINQPLPDHCIKLEGDAFDESLLDGPLGQNAPYDVVLSDMAPNTTGDKATDQIRSFDAFMRAVTLAERLLVPGGSFAGKIFMSGYFPEARDNLRKLFDTVRTMRPEAVRDISYEVFLVGIGKKVEA
jgi:23S rRNA (uridine2552-2'-O)-methyltransferase